ncbi:RICIN domain-containing protein [Pedobacter cryotolerans]|uniref:Uncharacterized protein n=1 Tax=Pedobacter cryotolerans TaxID=2571270 RepID=A0A4U1C745_9SPHI|nr:RICIN domain-containing protein [Pedobacter cryotolerans]TKC01177.1 hypothetical protein FA045_07990 [Pedobacter cryotolerans]
MKKLLFLLLLLPACLSAQIVNNRYKLSLVPSNLRMELASGNFIRVAEDCRDRTRGCGSQVWFVAGVRGKPNIYQITLIGSGKYLTWEEETPDAITLKINLEPRYPNEKQKFQQFIFTLNDKGSYQIQPAVDGNAKNEFYLGANFETGSYKGVRFFKTAASEFREVRFAWVLAPPITPLPVQNSGPVIVSAPSDNKIDIDFKTGADNLEMKPFQENVEIRILIRNKADAILLNANKDQNWPNNSIKRVTVPLPANITVDELKEIHVYRNRKNGGTPTTTVFNIAEKDNWNLDKITATARIKENGILKTYRFADLISPSGSSNPLFRFVYEGGNGKSEGQFFKGFLSSIGSGASTNSSANAANAKPVFKIETLTGGDDLRGGSDNLNVLIRLKIRPVRNIAINNINSSQKWDNFTEKTITKTITAAPFSFDDIEDIVLRHTGRGGIGADNWYLDKLKITLTIAGETRVLIDQVSAPIHYFKGDSRSKTFQILK